MNTVEADLHHQEPEGIYCLTAAAGGHLAFMTDLAGSDGKDGQGTAQALLKFVNGTDYTELRPLPEDPGESKMMQPTNIVVNENPDLVTIYPNPAQTGVTVSYKTKQAGQALVEVKDLLGKIIYANFINNQSGSYVPLNDCGNGVYIITVTKNKELIYKTKLIKQH